MPQRAAYRAGRAMGRARAMGQAWEQNRDVAMRMAMEDMRHKNRLQVMEARLKNQMERYKQEAEAEENREMRQKLAEEAGIDAAMSGKSLQDLPDLMENPHAQIAYSQTQREMAEQKAERQREWQSEMAERRYERLKEKRSWRQKQYTGLPQELKARIAADPDADPRDPASYRGVAQDYFREEEDRGRTEGMTREEIQNAANDEFKWLYKTFSAPEQLTGAYPGLAHAVRPDGRVDWGAVRAALIKKWTKVGRGGGAASKEGALPSPSERAEKRGGARERRSPADQVLRQKAISILVDENNPYQPTEKNIQEVIRQFKAKRR